MSVDHLDESLSNLQGWGEGLWHTREAWSGEESLEVEAAWLQSAADFAACCEEMVSRTDVGPVVRRCAWALNPALWAPVHGGSLMLRRLGARDTQAVHALLQEPTFLAHYSRGLPTELAQVAQWMRAAQAPRWPVRRIEFAVQCNKTGLLVGLASLADVSVEDRRAEFLVGVNPSLIASSLHSWGIEAAALLLYYAFERLGLAKLTSLVFEDNPRALRSTIGLGFVPEGRLRDHVWDRAGQKFFSVHVQSLLRTEYDQSQLLKRLRGRFLREPQIVK